MLHYAVASPLRVHGGSSWDGAERSLDSPENNVAWASSHKRQDNARCFDGARFLSRRDSTIVARHDYLFSVCPIVLVVVVVLVLGRSSDGTSELSPVASSPFAPLPSWQTASIRSRGRPRRRGRGGLRRGAKHLQARSAWNHEENSPSQRDD